MARGVRKAECLDPLVFESSLMGSARFQAWAAEFLVTPRGAGSGQPMRIWDWQLQIVHGILETERRNSLVVCPRGAGKSTLIAALALFLVLDRRTEGAVLPIFGATEAGSQRLLGVVKRMIQLSPELEKRFVVHHDRVVVPESASEILAVPPTVTAAEGGDYTLALVDEGGFLPNEVWQSILLSTGKQAGSGVVMIGTPPTPSWADKSPLLSWWRDCQVGNDPDTYLFEMVADHCDKDSCRDCLRSAYGDAIGTTIQWDDLVATMPPKVSQSEWRRARTCRFVSHSAESFVSPDLWLPLATDVPVPDGTRIVIGFDGSYSSDATALTCATVGPEPHLFVGGLWERPADAPADWTVPVLEVEDQVRALGKKFKVAELVADPFRWMRSLSVLEAEGFRVAKFPWSTSRAGAASADFRAGVLAGQLSHSGDADLNRHVLNAIWTDKGVPTKPSKHSTRHIDLLAAGIMAHSRATWLGRKKRGRVASFNSRRRSE